MTNFWEERYKSPEYAYGIKPNEFFKDQINQLPVGKILLPAEGEGRNAVYAAKIGWKVTAFDTSLEGKKKAMVLAEQEKVGIEYQTAAFESFTTHELFDCIAFIYAHIHQSVFIDHYSRLLGYLKPGGTVIFEGFSTRQLGNKSGGPPVLEMLFLKDQVGRLFSTFTNVQIEDTTTVLSEGLYHEGVGAIIRVVAK